MTGEATSESAVRIPTPGGWLAGRLSIPAGPPRPAVLLLGGTFSDLADGDPDPRHRPDIPPHGMYRHLADALAGAGLAVLRFDRRGSGESPGRRPERAREIDDAAAAWRWLDGRPEVAAAAGLVGESAGAYVACRLAAMGVRARATVLQGALFRPIPDLVAENGRRARSVYDRGPADRGWLWEHARREYESAVLLDATMHALTSGAPGCVAASDERGRFARDLTDLAYDLANPPASGFRHLRGPTLVLHGADDLNVSPEDAFDTVRALWAAGNRQASLVVLDGADHSLQVTPRDPEVRLRERLSFASFRRPFHPGYASSVATYLSARLLR